MDDWYSWYVLFKARETDLLAGLNHPKVTAEKDRSKSSHHGFFTAFRLILGGNLIRLGQRIIGHLPPVEEPACITCCPQN
jgi:hypothetical protein